MRRPVILFAAAVGLAAPLAVAGPEDATSSARHEIHKVEGITFPYREAVLAPVQPGRIATIAIPEGGGVRAGEIIYAIDDAVQRSKTAVAKARADSTLQVDLARAHWERAKREVERLTKLHGSESASSKELRDAQVDAEITRLEYELARFDLERAKLLYEVERAALTQFQVRAPFDGYVQEHLRHVGETVEESEGVVLLVQVDPVLVTVDCPLAVASGVAVGDEFPIRPVNPRWPKRKGTVVFASRVADGGSQTLRLKLAVDNRDAVWLAGLKVVAELREPASLSKAGNLTSPDVVTARDRACGGKGQARPDPAISPVR